MISFTPLPLYTQGKSPRYPVDKRLGGSQRRPERCGEVKIQYRPETRTLANPSSIPQPVAISTALPQIPKILYEDDNLIQDDKP
jgi:hypothetical protein